LKQQPGILLPDWPCPANVRSVITTRDGGVSRGPYASFNLADHVGDDSLAVEQNRQQLQLLARLPRTPAWLKQVHGTRVVNVADAGTETEADGSYAIGATGVCVVLTADCLPVLLTDEAGSRVAALHAGWRGLANGIVEQGVEVLNSSAPLMAYLGPAIGPRAFEVGDDVVEAFCQFDSQAEQAFTATVPGKWLADIYRLARQRLQRLGITRVFGGGDCTFTEVDRFYSYRRDRDCGRMASLIWIEPER